MDRQALPISGPVRKPKTKPLTLAILTLVILLLGWMVWRMVRHYGPFEAADDLPNAVAQYRATGLPWVAEDLEPPDPLPETEDAASLIDQSSHNLEKLRADALIGEAAKLVKKGDYDGAKRLLQPLDPQVDWARQEVQIGSAHFIHDWDTAPNETFTNLKTLKAQSKLLAYRADWEASHGEDDAAINDLAVIRGLAHLASLDQTMIPFLVQISIDAVGCRAEQDCAAIWINKPTALEKLSDFKARPVETPDFARSLRGEAYTGIVVCRNLSRLGTLDKLNPESDMKIDPHDLVRSGVPADAMSRAFMDRCLKYWTEADAILKADKGHGSLVGRDLETLSDRYENMHSVSDILTAIINPVFQSGANAVTDLQAENLATKALVCALQIHAKTGAFPDEIEKIPGTWKDPWTGHPLHLKLKGGGIRIYSTGRSGVDHGGTDRSEVRLSEADSKGFDIVAAYPVAGEK